MSLVQQSIAAHRFGLGEPSLAGIGDPVRWLQGQLAAPPQPWSPPPKPVHGEQDAEETRRRRYRDWLRDEAEARWAHQIDSAAPFAERLVTLWCNHFTVSALRGPVAPLVGAFERDAIRPHACGRFGDMLQAATLHPAMLRYLDNVQSVGPDSPAGGRGKRGLNENLARELLELHALGVDGGYSQDDVRALAAVLTGWTVDADSGETRFDARRHQPGAKRILGRRYAEDGEGEIRAVLRDLAATPACARHVADRLARHFVADEPPPALVQALSRHYLDSGGDLAEVCRALVAHPLVWDAGFPKLKLPEELGLSAYRLLGLHQRVFEGVGASAQAMGQRVGAAPSPAGWADRAEDWLGTDAMWKRIEWAARLAGRVPAVDARSLAESSLAERLGPASRAEIARADSPRQALTLFLAAPEFQRR